MNHLSLTPQLRLHDSEKNHFVKGNGAGLLALVRETGSESCASELFFRKFARDIISRWCRVPERDDRRLAPVFEAGRPALETLAFTIFEAPPMTGLEYLSAQFLRQLCGEFETAVESEYENFRGSFTEFLRTLGENWKHVGKITFHLAENKSDSSGRHPFAFMASFAYQLGAGDHPKHLPLASALKAYAGDREALRAVIDPMQAAAEKSALLRRLLDSRQIFQPTAWTAPEAYRFLQDIPVFEAANIVVRITNLWKTKPVRATVSVTLDTKNPEALNMAALLNFSVGVTLGGEPLTKEEVEEILVSGGGLMRLRGQWVEADSEKIAHLLNRWEEARRMAKTEGITLAEGLRLLSENETAGVAGDTDSDAGFFRVEARGTLEKMLGDLRNPSQITLPALPEKLRATLRPYQLDGVKYLWQSTALGLGPCLADDMGLGKTLQILSLILLWKRAGILAELPALLVLPATLLANWRAESERFTPELRLTVLHPSEMQPCETEAFARDPAGYLKGFDIALVTYGMVTRLSALPELEFPAVIADEAQAVKNPDAKQSKALRHLRGKRRIALTGTPVENRLSDLWSIFDFINPGLLGTAGAFKTFTKKLDNNYAPLRRLTQPFILRRLKTDKRIITDLPDKTELKVYCNLTKKQAVLYEKTVASMQKAIEENDSVRRRGLIFSCLMQFKQICNHADQFTGTGDYHAAGSGKFARIAELVESIASRQERLLVFTQFREMTEPLHAYLAECFGTAGLILHGGTPVAQRAELVRRFQSEDGPPFFVLSLKAAGTGLNLTAANHVIHFDRWWNPAVENQASDRAFRIGQKRNVLVHKFICRGTLEEKIDALIAGKQNLADELLSEGAEKLLTAMSNEELLNLVKLDLTAQEN